MPRILFISNNLPVPPTTGSVQRTNLLLRALRMIADVDVVSFVGKIPSDPEIELLKREWGYLGLFHPPVHSDLPPWNLIKRLNPRLVQRLAHNLGRRSLDYQAISSVQDQIRSATEGKSYDLAVGRYLLPTIQSGVAEWLPTIVDVDDLDTQVYATRLNAPGQSPLAKWIVRRHLKQLEAILPSRLAEMRSLWMANENDLPLVQSHPDVSVVPNIPFAFANKVPDAQPPSQSGHVAIVVGSMDHQPNRRGVDRLVTKVWPSIRRSCPDAILRIVGSRMSDEQKNRWGSVPGVEPIGFVEDLAQAYRNSSFSICPIYEGGGTKIKVLESLAYNRTCVTTKHSIIGYESILKDGEALCITQSDEQMVDVVLRLFSNPELSLAMASRARELVIEHFSFKRFALEVKSTVDRVIG